MSIRLRFPVSSAAAALLLAASAQALTVGELSRVRMTHPQIVSTDSFDFCLKDASGSVLRFSSATGAYAFCGNDGTFEQGTGTITTQNGILSLSHSFRNPALLGLESVHATVDTASGQGQATLWSSREGQGKFARLSINDPNVHDASDCSTCFLQSAVNEGVINPFVVPTSSIGFGTSSLREVTFLQSYSLNSGFDGRVTTLTAGIGRQGAGALSFQLAVYSDDHGQPGALISLGPVVHFPDFPALPTIGIVRFEVGLETGPDFWAGIRWNPSTDPLYLPYGTDSGTPLSKVFFCEPGHACESITGVSGFQDARSLFFSLDYRYPASYASGGFVRFGDRNPLDLISDKCDSAYELIQNVPHVGLVRLYAENDPDNAFPPSSYSGAFARVDAVSASDGTGLDGPAESSYAGTRYKAFSYVTSHGLDYCTRPDDATDFVCHPLAGYQPGTCGYTRIVGVKSGFELSCANAPADWIDRWFVSYDGSAWSSQALDAVKGSPSIGSPEFGFNWYAASGSKLGVAYEYKLTSGLIQAQLLKGNAIVGTYTVDTDDPPAGFNPNLATRMAGDCTRSGLCVFGRFDAHTQTNVADMIDFRETPPEIKSWVIGPSPAGFGFGRAVNIDSRDGTALYGSYAPSPIANQFRLQLDYIDLKAYRKSTLGFDYAVGLGNYPMALSRAGGDWGLGVSKGVGLFYSLTAGCKPARVDGRSGGNDSGSSHPSFPCENIPSIHGRF